MSKKRQGRIVAVDCMTLIWGIRKHGPQDRMSRARRLFDGLQAEDAVIIVPSVVLAEYLIAVPDEAKEETANRMQMGFQVEPFDARDAVLAARLWREGKSQREMKKQGSRICLKADTLIIATAKNRGAIVFYTEDKDCLALARKVMPAKELPIGYLLDPS